MAETENVFKRNKSLFIFLIGLIVLCALIYALREPLLPFLIGFIIAYLLLPVVNWVDKRLPFHKKGREIQRIVIIIVVFLVLLAIIGLVIFLVAAPFIGSFSKLIASAPTVIRNGLETFGKWFDSLLRNLTPEQQKQTYDILNSTGSAIGGWLQNSFLGGLSHIPSTFTYIVGFMTLPFFLILFMANAHNLGKGFYSLFSSEMSYHVRNFAKILDRVAGRYIRATILLAIVMGILVYIALMIIGIKVAPALAVVAAAFQLVPAIGGALAAIVGVIVTLGVAPAKVIWVIIAYLIINLVGGSVLVAKFQGDALNMDSSIVMLLIVLGGFLGGPLGMIIIAPAVAVIYAVYKYVRQELQRSQTEEVQQV